MLSRNEDLQQKLLASSEWDLIICDEAHRMSASYFGGDVKHTKCYQLGQQLGQVCRHLLLMCATPHNGKEEGFQLFMALRDGDRFEGRFGAVAVSDEMLRNVDEYGQDEVDDLEELTSTGATTAETVEQLEIEVQKSRYRRLIDRIVRVNCHMIICTRVKPVLQDPRSDRNARKTKTRRADVPWDVAGDAEARADDTDPFDLPPLPEDHAPSDADADALSDADRERIAAEVRAETDRLAREAAGP